MLKTVVLEIGTRSVRAGLAGEPRPRAVLPSSLEGLFASEAATTELSFIEHTGPLLQNIFLDHLQCRPKSCRVLVLEPLLAPRSFRAALLHCLHVQLGVVEVAIIPSPLTALHATGQHTGVIVDVGHRESRVLAMVDGCPLLPSLRVCPLGVAHVTRGSRDDHGRLGSAWLEGDWSAQQASVRAEDALARSCVVKPFRGPGGGSAAPATDTASGSVVAGAEAADAEVLFDASGGGLAAELAACLSRCPVDVRRHCAAHVVVVGGGSMIRGLVERLRLEAARLVGGAIGQVLDQSPGGPRSHFPGSAMAWVGGSLVASVDGAIAPLIVVAGQPLPDFLSLDRTAWFTPPPLRSAEVEAAPPKAAKVEWACNENGQWSPSAGRPQAKAHGGARLAVAGVGVVWVGQ